MNSRLPLGTHRSFAHLMADYNILVSSSALSKWRLLYPNVGQLDGFPHFGNVLICATDGLEALYHVDESDFLWKGHLKAFNGPVAKEWVSEDDWDFVRRVRLVQIFRRRDGSFAFIPKDSVMDSYWEVHPRMSHEEKDLYARLIKLDRMTIYYGEVQFKDFDRALEFLRARKTKLTKSQQILATL